VSGDAMLKYLGVPGNAPARRLLGLTDEPPTPETVEAGLRAAIGRTFRHPQGRSDEAEAVRRRLRALAATLVPAPPTRARPRPVLEQLTEFDRAVLAVLISSGSWNAATRARLVGVAGSYGVSVQGLIKVVTGLSEYAKSGGPRLEVAHIAGAAPLAPPPDAANDNGAYDWVQRIAPELRDDSAAATFKLSMLFGLLTVLVGALAARVLFAPREAAPPLPEPPAVSAPAERAAVVSPPIADTAEPGAQPAAFERRPTFRARGLTAASAAAADRCPDVAPRLAELSNRLAAADEPADTVLEDWDTAVGTVATGWVLVDRPVLDGIGAAIFEALYAASDQPSVTDRLLAGLTPPSSRTLEPEDIWRGAWTSGTLAEISGSPGLPPAVVQRAGVQLQQALGGNVPPDRRFETAATAWLAGVVPRLLEITELDPASLDLWEFWIAAQRRLGAGPRFQHAAFDAIEAVLATSLDLGRVRPTVDVLGRLLELVDFQSSPVARARLVAIFEDTKHVDGRDLWALTGLLDAYGPPWFDDQLLAPESADWVFRRRLADKLAARWPETAATAEPGVAKVAGIPVDAALASRWLAQRQRLDDAPIAVEQAGRLDQLAAAAWLNEIAHRLANGDAETAGRHLDDLERGAMPGGAGGPPPVRPGAPIGTDGQWAVEYDRAGRDVEQRMSLLQQLQATAGTDLGTADAATLVAAAYRDSPAEVRAMAQDVLVAQFAAGPGVALEMLDQLPQASPSESTSDTIRRLTGRMLPSTRHETWPREARLALVAHNLGLRDSASTIDDRMDAVHQAYESRIQCLEPAGPTPTTDGAAAALAEAWWEQAARDGYLAAPGGMPAEPADIERRRATRARVAQGPLQRFVAAQITVLDLMAFTAASARPSLAPHARGLLDESARRRREAADVLAQAIEAERAMGRLWSLQFAQAPGGAALAPLSRPAWIAATLLAAQPVTPGAPSAPPAPSAAETWQRRLEALDPARPMAYLELAEEVADASGDDEHRALARQLFALAGVLDPGRLGRSACLALADLEPREPEKRRLLALAELLDDRAGPETSEPAAETMTDFDVAAALAVGEALSFYRRGEGNRALPKLGMPGASELIDACQNVFRGGAARFIEDCRLYKGGRRPSLTETDLVSQLRLEAALLAGGRRTWSGDLLLSRGRPLPEVDPDRLDESLGVNGERACWREGKWMSCQ